jgi:hypothetical protein
VGGEITSSGGDFYLFFAAEITTAVLDFEKLAALSALSHSCFLAACQEFNVTQVMHKVLLSEAFIPGLKTKRPGENHSSPGHD